MNPKRIVIEMECVNAAFDDENWSPEIRRILIALGSRIGVCDYESGDSFDFTDVNGNRVGTCRFE